MINKSKSSPSINKLFSAFISISVIAQPCLAVSQHNNANPPPILPPDQTLGSLFAAVQQAKIFPDQKTFADAVPKFDPQQIVAQWQQKKVQDQFNLANFVAENFTLPANQDGYRPPINQSLREHINGLWSKLTRYTPETSPYSSLLPLPKSYVVPGGRFTEIYYWDSYFTMLGLAESGHWDRVADMVDNFAYQLDHYGHIPNGNRSYYLSRSQPPFFSLMVDLLATHQGESIYRHYLPQLAVEYHYWMAGSEQLEPGQASQRVIKLADGSLLNRYWDQRDVPRTESWLDDWRTAQPLPDQTKAQLYRDLRSSAASGWDFSSRWLSHPQQLTTIRTTQLAPVDLNSLLFHLEQTLANAYQLSDQSTLAQQFTEIAKRRQQAINHYFWDQKNGWYADYLWQSQQIHSQLTAATLFPLYLKIATPRQAESTAKGVAQQLVKPGGLVTTTIHSGQQWDAPNGWAPLQWIAVEGLENYHQTQLARDIGWRFLRNIQMTYDKKHKLVEKYVVEGSELGGGQGGEYALQDGFGWTNGVTLKLLDKYCPRHKTCNSAYDIAQLTVQSIK